MTREEALQEIVERVRSTEYVDSVYVDSVDIEALRIAIEALKMAIEAPTKPEIVRCEYCKHRQPDEQKYMCVLTITEQNCKQFYMNDNDFCSFGKRRENDFQ